MKERIEDQQTTWANWLAEAFAQNPHHAATNVFVQRFKQEQLGRFLARGLPSRREEAWKYADLSFLEKTAFDWPAAQLQENTLQALIAARAKNNTLFVLMNGQFAPQRSSTMSLPAGVIVCSLQQALEKHAALVYPYLLREMSVEQHPLACLNTALLSDGLFLYVPENVILEKPIHVLSVATAQQGFMMQPRHVVVMENNAQLTLTEEYVADEAANQYLTNAVLDCFVGKNALLNYYKVQNEAPTAKHFAHVFVHQQQHSVVNACSFALGGQLARQEMNMYLQEKNASCTLKGFYGLSRDGQWLDHHLFVDHAAPQTHSDIDFHGVVAEQARAVFNGKVLVQAQAQKTVARQFNRNMLLSPWAEIDTKPDLEIYADDVQCQHGATVGQLDEEALFYLRARGVAYQEAVMLLLQAFMEKALSSVTLPWLAQVMREQWAAAVVNFS